jgi:hypothetical protein
MTGVDHEKGGVSIVDQCVSLDAPDCLTPWVTRNPYASLPAFPRVVDLDLCWWCVPATADGHEPGQEASPCVGMSLRPG